MKPKLLTHDTTNGTEWFIYELDFGYQAVVRYKVLLGKYRTRRLKTLTYNAAKTWIDEQI